MHPHTDAEDQTLLSSNYAISVRTVVAAVQAGVFAEESENTGPSLPPYGRGIQQLRPTLKSILGYEPFLSARVSADLEQPVMSADIRLHMGGGNYGNIAPLPGGENWQSLAPLNFRTNNSFEGGAGPYWDWLDGRRRALLDTGIYVRLESKLTSDIPTVVVPPPPEIENIGPQVASTSPDPVAVPWPSHSTGRIGVLVVQSANQAVTLGTPAGFVEVGTAAGIGTAGTGTGVSFGNATEFTGTANPTTASHAAVANTKGVVVYITQPIVSTDIVTGVTYGGVAMTRVGTYADTNATAGGRVYAYFLGTSVPSGTQTVNVARSQTTTTIHVVVNGIVAGTNTEVVTSAGVASSDATGGMSNPMVTLNYGGRSALGFVGMYSSIDNIIGSSTEPTGQQRVHDHDFGTETSIVSRRSTAESNNQTMGWTFNGQRLAMLAVAVSEVAGAATRIHTYWCRATSNAMAAPLVNQPGDHLLAFIYTIRNALDAGNPVNTSAGGFLSPASTSVFCPAVTPTARSLIVNHVTIATKTTTPQFSNWSNSSLGFSETTSTGVVTYTAAERVDRATTIGLGGGIGIFSGPKQLASTTGLTSATLATASVKALQTLAFTANPIRAVASDPNTVLWRPFFVGRIDTVDPAEDSGDVLTLHCRDVHCDVLDPWIVPDIGTNGVQFDSSQIEDLLGDMLSFANSGPVIGDIPFAVIGDPDMGVPAYYQEPQSVLLAMRQAGLQNGWDLRGRWGTSPYGENVYVLTYYEPDRALISNPFDLGPSRYFEIGSFPLSREDVRNTVEVIPGQPPRTPVRVSDINSQIDYGSTYLRMAYDKTSLIRTAAQAQTLADAVLSDVSLPKVQAEILTRFHPWVELNDLLRLAPNNVHHSAPLTLAVSGYEHNLTEDGHGTTTIRTRLKPAAAFREWRRGTDLTHILATVTPSGVAPERATWSQVIGDTTTTPVEPPTGTTAAPQYVAAGNFAAATSAVSPSWPAGHRVNDIGLLEVQTANQALGTTPTGWAYIGTLPVGTGTAGAAGSTMAHWLWKRATSTAESAASIGDSGDHQVARIHIVRGAIATGSPINVASTPAAVTSAVTGVIMGGATTTVDNCLVVAYVANAVDLSTPQAPSTASDWTNADLTGKQVIASIQTGQGVGGGMSAMVGVKATAGAYTFTTTSLTNASKQITGSFAITPAVA